jgi:DnaJ-class molecular chaperone
MTPAKTCNIPGYKVCSFCQGTGEHEIGNIDSVTGYHGTANCRVCEGEGTVVDEDACCESCFAAGKVVEYDVRLADGTQLCYDCADSNNPRVNEQ